MDLSLIALFFTAAAMTLAVALIVSLAPRALQFGARITQCIPWIIAPVIVLGYLFAHWRLAGPISRPVDSASEFVFIAMALGGPLLSWIEASGRTLLAVRWPLRFGAIVASIAVLLSRYADYYEWSSVELGVVSALSALLACGVVTAAIGIQRRHSGALALAVLVGLACASSAVFGLTGNAKVGLLLGVVGAALTPIVFIAHRLPIGAIRGVIAVTVFGLSLLWTWGVAGGETAPGMAGLLALAPITGYVTSLAQRRRGSRPWWRAAIVFTVSATIALVAVSWAAIDFVGESETATDYSDYGY